MVLHLCPMPLIIVLSFIHDDFILLLFINSSLLLTYYWTFEPRYWLWFMGATLHYLLLLCHTSCLTMKWRDGLTSRLNAIDYGYFCLPRWRAPTLCYYIFTIILIFWLWFRGTTFKYLIPLCCISCLSMKWRDGLTSRSNAVDYGYFSLPRRLVLTLCY